jgi:2-oxoglutarate ferredoxin oxidoreductase subunit alpha
MTTPRAAEEGGRETVDSVVIRFAGDSGDGIQVTGTQFTTATAVFGNDFATFPDFPAEIRAPAGTTFGVSAFQIRFGSDVVHSGDQPDTLVAMNPAALKVNLPDLKKGGMVVVDQGAFTARNLSKAGYDASPLENGVLSGYRVIPLDISKMTLEAVKPFGLSQKEALRCKNFWTLGLMLWMYGRDREPAIEWLSEKFSQRPELAQANIAALNAGHVFGEAVELSSEIPVYAVAKAEAKRGVYRAVTGSEALVFGLLAGGRAANLRLVFGSYPITPASSLLHMLAKLKSYGVTTFQAEDEIAAACFAIGASFAGALGVTSSSGPGVALKAEAIGLAVITELPLVIINSQRAGPSTGMPTKTDQGDLFQAVYGRNSDAPLPVIASSSPADCFEVAFEAVRLASRYMTPVILLTDGYLANATEPWLLPDVDALPKFPVEFRTEVTDFQPYARDPESLARAWAIPGTPGLEHRIGGLEKDYETGNVSYDAENHQRMTDVRLEKISRIAGDIPLQNVQTGSETGAMVVVGWGSSFGAISEAVTQARAEGLDVSHIHIRHIWPLPRNLGDLLKGFEKVMVAEMNTGQLLTLLRSSYLVPAEGIQKVTGKPFHVREILDAIRSNMEQ